MQIQTGLSFCVQYTFRDIKNKRVLLIPKFNEVLVDGGFDIAASVSIRAVVGTTCCALLLFAEDADVFLYVPMETVAECRKSTTNISFRYKYIVVRLSEIKLTLECFAQPMLLTSLLARYICRHVILYYITWRLSCLC